MHTVMCCVGKFWLAPGHMCIGVSLDWKGGAECDAEVTGVQGTFPMSTETLCKQTRCPANLMTLQHTATHSAGYLTRKSGLRFYYTMLLLF